MSKVQDTFTHVDGVGTRSIRHMIETISQGDDLTPGSQSSLTACSINSQPGKTALTGSLLTN